MREASKTVIEKRGEGMPKQQINEEVNIKELITLEEELHSLKEQYQISEEKKGWIKFGDYITERLDRKKVQVNRKKYIKLAAGCGWLCGAHRFYTGQKGLGLLYLLFCWSGIPFTMTLIDLMIVLPKKADENGDILI